tara:strand:- start:25 stop:129 length:105 start_codon:yes stop_codon:yes gene_type:complete
MEQQILVAVVEADPEVVLHLQDRVQLVKAVQESL